MRSGSRECCRNAITNSGSETLEHRGSGRAAPLPTITDFNGQLLEADEYKGKIVLVNLWATWCAPCEAETPALINLQKRYGDQLAIIALSVDDDPSVVRKFSDRFGINYNIAMLDGQADRAYDQLLGLPDSRVIRNDGMINAALPTSLLFDRTGHVVRIYLGPDTRALSEAIAKLNPNS